MVRVIIDTDLNLGLLVDAVAEETGWSRADTQETVQAVVDVIGRALTNGKKVKITNAFSLEPGTRRIPAGALGGRVAEAREVPVVRFHLNGRLHDAIRNGEQIHTLKKTGKLGA